MIFRGYFLKFFSFIRKNCKIMNASMKLKKVLKIKLISWIFLGSSLIFLILSAIFPKTRPILDDIRLFFQKYLFTEIAEFRYRSKINHPVIISKLLSAKKLTPGDLIFTSNTDSLGSTFINGKWKHIALYLWTPKQLKNVMGKKSPFYQKIKNLNFPQKTPLIIESTFSGVQISPLDTLKPSEALLAIRPEISKKTLRAGIELLTEQIGKAYDFDFNTEDTTALYCSELLTPTFSRRGFSPISEETLLRTVIPPDAMLNALLTKKKKTPKTHLIFYVESDGETRHFLGKEILRNSI